MDLWKSLAGMLEVELTSAEPEAALSAVNNGRIALFRVERRGALTLGFQILRRDYPALSRLCEKRGESLKIVKRRGLYWAGQSLLRRRTLLLGLALLLALALFLPSRVLFIRVEGNVTVPTRQILEAAESCGIRFGASRREVRSEKVKNALLGAVPQLQWAGVNTAGCVATISVGERTETETTEQEWAVTSIVAARDGYILSGTATRGSALFQPGQTVTEGQVLISGYTNCGICIQATQAEGEIIAQTSRELEAVTPSQLLQRTAQRDSGRSYSLLIGKKRINLWKDSGIWDASCGRMYEEYVLTLPGGFQLPLALCVETYIAYNTQPLDVPQEDAEAALQGFAERYLSGQMVAGEILDSVQRFSPEDGLYRLKGDYVCREMISRVRREEIGDRNGENG